MKGRGGQTGGDEGGHQGIWERKKREGGGAKEELKKGAREKEKGEGKGSKGEKKSVHEYIKRYYILDVDFIT